MDDQNPQKQSPQADSSAVMPVDQSAQNQPVDRDEQEELNEVKNLEKEEQEEAQTDAAKVDERIKDGVELEKEEQNPSPQQPEPQTS